MSKSKRIFTFALLNLVSKEPDHGDSVCGHFILLRGENTLDDLVELSLVMSDDGKRIC